MRYHAADTKAVMTIIVITIGALVTVGVLNVAVTGDLFGSISLSNVGTVKAIGVRVYWDNSCGDLVGSVDWGLVERGATKNITVYIRNEGSVPVTLSLATDNWGPSNAPDYLSLAWDYGDQGISVDGVVQVTLSLSVSEAIEGITSFSFDIVIIGSG
jgi:hypothetical protein